ncbi:MAG: hypothetical protein PHI28_05260 [Mangrovibacterium sp.]|nr:hypothetical protein [Mangrovibacterium sp.]
MQAEGNSKNGNFDLTFLLPKGNPGKRNIYLQKPMTMHLGKSLAVRNAIKKHKVISQIGTHIHAGEHYRRMVELVRSGNLGEIATVRTFFVMNEAPGGIGTGNNTSAVPEGLDWDKWVGPAPIHPFNPKLVEECIKSRKQPSCNAEYHVKVDIPVALSVLSMKLGRSIKFDPASGQITGDPEAARMAIPEYRAPWKFPAEYL